MLRKGNAPLQVAVLVIASPAIFWVLFHLAYGCWWIIDLFVDFSSLSQAINTAPGVDLTPNQLWWLAFGSLFVFGKRN